MKLGIAALLAILAGATVVLASPRPRPEPPLLLARHAIAERFCKSQRRDCRVLSRSLTGLSCVCR